MSPHRSWSFYFDSGQLIIAPFRGARSSPSLHSAYMGVTSSIMVILFRLRSAHHRSIPPARSSHGSIPLTWVSVKPNINHSVIAQCRPYIRSRPSFPSRVSIKQYPFISLTYGPSACFIFPVLIVINSRPETHSIPSFRFAPFLHSVLHWRHTLLVNHFIIRLHETYTPPQVSLFFLSLLHRIPTILSHSIPSFSCTSFLHSVLYWRHTLSKIISLSVFTKHIRPRRFPYFSCPLSIKMQKKANIS